ncbi:MAG: 4-hydroxythreonine-4-phosphate dehydrogenase PdxA [Lewinella sp.]|nr:4-hydroxythreonine-4-phosphate dehydrogenase PdxA [Lewinella sp.]
MDKPRIGISIGDFNGIGLEVILKTVAQPGIQELCTPVIYGSSKVVSYHKNIIEADFHFHSIREADQAHAHKVNIVNCWQDTVNINLGKPTEESGQFAALSLEYAVRDLRDGKLDALVTAPINKHAMQLGGGFRFPGHTEYLTKELGAQQSLMLMVNDQLRIGLVTNHIPISEVAHQITKELIMEKINIFQHTLIMDFGIERPTIALLGLNPHAGDNGLLGEAEEQIIRPAIVESKKGGKLVMGPFPADDFFGSGQYAKFDGILAMYHDQGLIPFKLLSFGKGVNYTAGLSAIRTSPDHGTAYDLAGQNSADPSSFRQALFMAMDLFRQRRDYLEMHDNPLRIEAKPDLRDEEDEILLDDED